MIMIIFLLKKTIFLYVISQNRSRFSYLFQDTVFKRYKFVVCSVYEKIIFIASAYVVTWSLIDLFIFLSSNRVYPYRLSEKKFRNYLFQYTKFPNGKDSSLIFLIKSNSYRDRIHGNSELNFFFFYFHLRVVCIDDG